MSRTHRPSRREVAAGALSALAAASAGGAARAASPPNILFILADDMGYADLSCYGRRDYKTPHIDSLARDGALLTQAYANSAVCTPTRVALITGRYQHRLAIGREEPSGMKAATIGLPPEHPTLPSLLRAAGYRTSLVGKWHMGDAPRFGPLKSGYERFFGFYPGGADYFTHVLSFGGATPPGAGLYDGDQHVEREGYLTDLLGDRASADIAEFARGPAPFFISLHFNAPHWPWEGPDDRAKSLALKDPLDRAGGSLATYAKMVASLDANVGKVLGALARAGVSDNTIVVFTSDNGGERFGDMWPFIGMKGELLEGGLRVPLLVRWPGRIPAASRSDQVMITMDWAPTLLAAAGAKPDPAYPPDGENLLPMLTGAAAAQPRKLYWRMRAAAQAALRDGDWKYLRLAGKEHLFNLAEDVRERGDLKDAHPQAFARLKAEWEAWAATMPPYDSQPFTSIEGSVAIDRY